MNKLLFLLMGMLVLSLVGAETIEEYEVGVQSTLPFTCTNSGELPSSSTTLNITLIDPDGVYVLENAGTQAKGNGEFNYTYTFQKLGIYKIIVFCFDGINNGSVPNYYKITPTGNSGNENTSFFLILIAGIYIITFVGFFGKNPIISLLGSMFMIALGLYLIINGVIIYRDWITNYFAYLTIGLGLYIAYLSAEELWT